MSDPIGVTEGAFEALGLRVPVGAAEHINAFLHAQRSQREAPPASYDRHGYTRDDVWSDPAMASYRATFEVPVEARRLTEAVTPTSDASA